MSSVIIASVPVHGHVAPLLPIARALVERGDDVRFLTGSRFADAVEATGARHVALRDDADFDDRIVTSLFPERERLSPVKAIPFDIEHIFIRPGLTQHAALRALLDEHPADAVVCDPLFVGAAVLAEQPASARPPVVVAGVVPLSYPGPGLAPYGLGLAPLAGPAGAVRNAVLRAATRSLFRGVDSAGREVTRRAVGREPSSSIMTWLPRADAIAQLTVREFEYPRPHAPESLVFTGPVATSDVSRHELPRWWPQLEHARRVVHVTQGTIANDDLGELVRPTIDAFAGSDTFVAVATGGVPVASLGTLPANVGAAEFLPYDLLLPRTDVFVTNGGYGGTQFALRHGVPIVVAPGKEDKTEVAARVAWSGVGVNLRRMTPRPGEIRSAVERVLGDPRHRRAAGRIAAAMAQAPGTAGVTAVIDDAIARHARAGAVPAA